MSTLPPRDYNSKPARNISTDIKFLKYEPKYHSITDHDLLLIPTEWLTYLKTLKEYNISTYSSEILNDILTFLEKLSSFSYCIQFNPPKSLIHNVDENLKKIYSAYINKDNEEIEKLLSNISISLLLFILQTNDNRKNLVQIENFSETLVNLSNINVSLLISKLQ